jgi:hypothetical protein
MKINIKIAKEYLEFNSIIPLAASIWQKRGFLYNNAVSF